jgi:hypothetical protein
MTRVDASVGVGLGIVVGDGRGEGMDGCTDRELGDIEGRN